MGLHMVRPLFSLARNRLAISLLVIGLGLFSAQALKQVDQDLRVLYAEYTLAATDLAHVGADVMRYRNTVIKALGTPTKKEFEHTIASLQNQRAHILKIVERSGATGARVSRRGLGRDQEIREVQKGLEAYFVAEDRTVSLFLSAWTAQSTREAVEFRNQAERNLAGDAADRLVQAILALDRFQETVASVGKELNNEGTRVIQDVSTILLLGSVLIGLLNLYLGGHPIGGQ